MWSMVLQTSVKMIKRITMMVVMVVVVMMMMFMMIKSTAFLPVCKCLLTMQIDIKDSLMIMLRRGKKIMMKRVVLLLTQIGIAEVSPIGMMIMLMRMGS